MIRVDRPQEHAAPGPAAARLAGARRDAMAPLDVRSGHGATNLKVGLNYLKKIGAFHVLLET